MRLSALAVSLAALATACTVGVPTEQRAAEDRGGELVVAYGCVSCHQVADVQAAQGRVGPPLDTFGLRRSIAGTLPNNAENAVRWIRDPQDVQPGSLMPDLGVTEQDARDIVAYLYGLEGAPAEDTDAVDPAPAPP